MSSLSDGRPGFLVTDNGGPAEEESHLSCRRERPKLALNWKSSCPGGLQAGITDVYQYAWLAPDFVTVGVDIHLEVLIKTYVFFENNYYKLMQVILDL